MSDHIEQERRSVRVEIAGEEYSLRTDAEEAYTRQCASLVDERMKAIGGGSMAHLKKTAILAALSLASDLLQHQSRTREQALVLTKRIEEVL